jgi:hypothetical protein
MNSGSLDSVEGFAATWLQTEGPPDTADGTPAQPVCRRTRVIRSTTPFGLPSAQAKMIFARKAEA